MNYAEVAVNSPIAQRRTFSYSIPPRLDIDIGQAVWVPFGARILQGIVVGLSDCPSVEVTKEIADVITPDLLLSLNQVRLATWLSEYYLSPLFSAVALMLPPGFERRLITVFQLLSHEENMPALNPEQKAVLHFLRGKIRASLKELTREFGKKKTEMITNQLLRYNVVTKIQQLESIKVKPKVVSYLKLEVSPVVAEVEAAKLGKSRSRKQAAVIDFLIKQPNPVPLAQLRNSLSCPASVIESLRKRGLVSVTGVEFRRDPLVHLKVAQTSAPAFTLPQQSAWQNIQQGLVEQGKTGSPSIFLLHGVTGSGKTEIYLRAFAEVVARGKRGICLVPEISLTPQTIERFVSRFPGRVAVMHSALSTGEQFDEWHRIKGGGCDVVIGPRSALFAPQPDLGLIVIDEEHEWTYKQSEKSPRYHARETAIKLAEKNGTVVILGSATPDVETFYRCQHGEYQLVELSERITPRGLTSLPEVEIVDLRVELREGNRSLFSRSLSRAMSDALARKEQIILFLNRRGAANFIQCWSCGFVPSCRRCSVALTYHSVTRTLICHHCHYSCPFPQVCPQCFSHSLKFLGVGTQRVEEEVKHLFPGARVLRWDRDVTSRRRAHEEILAQFKNHEADVLVGTQMIAKGLDLPQVTLAGVVSADTGLNLPDFRAGERTFQLLCQVAGRAGRGVVAGRVVVQTYSPEHYAIQAASNHDYIAFYGREIDYRRQFGYPPFARLARLAFSHTNATVCRREAEKVAQMLLVEKDRQGLPGLKLIGPTPSFVPRLRGRYQWQILLCGDAPGEFLSGMSFSQGWVLDIDPVGVI